MSDEGDINLIVSVVQNGGFFDRGTLTLFALDCPTEQVIVEWEDGSRSQQNPQDALEKITMGALMGKHPSKVFLTTESLARLRGDAAKPELTMAEQTLLRVMPETTLAEIHGLKTKEAAWERLKAEQGTLFFKVASLLYKFDVEGVVFDEHEHEYEGEAGTIIPRLAECQNEQDCARVIHEEFAKWFSGRVRPIEAYGELGIAVWEVWQTENSLLSR